MSLASGPQPAHLLLETQQSSSPLSFHPAATGLLAAHSRMLGSQRDA